MSISNASVMGGAAVNSVTGGTAVNYSADGQQVTNGVHVSDTTVADFRVRPGITFKVKQPVLNGLVWSKDKKSATLVRPKLLASGLTVFNLIRIEIEVHPESTSAEALELRTQGAQLCYDADFTNFWTLGALT